MHNAVTLVWSRLILLVLIIHTSEPTLSRWFAFQDWTKTFVLQIAMNVMMQMEDVNTGVLTPLGASTAAVTKGTSWMEMD